MKKSILLKKVGNKIKKVRLTQGVVQGELVIRMEENYGKVDETNISRIEAGITNPMVFSLYRNVGTLKVPLEDLVKIKI